MRDYWPIRWVSRAEMEKIYPPTNVAFPLSDSILREMGFDPHRFDVISTPGGTVPPFAGRK